MHTITMLACLGLAIVCAQTQAQTQDSSTDGATPFKLTLGHYAYRNTQDSPRHDVGKDANLRWTQGDTHAWVGHYEDRSFGHQDRFGADTSWSVADGLALQLSDDDGFVGEAQVACDKQAPQDAERAEAWVSLGAVREVSELGYHDYILNELPENEYIGELVKEKLMYYPTVTRESFRNQGRLTDLIRSGKLADDLGLPELNPQTDRVMICGSPAMLAELVEILKERGFTEGTSRDPGEYVIERAFVEK